MAGEKILWVDADPEHILYWSNYIKIAEREGYPVETVVEYRPGVISAKSRDADFLIFHPGTICPPKDVGRLLANVRIVNPNCKICLLTEASLEALQAKPEHVDRIISQVLTVDQFLAILGNLSRS